jgi:YgiT-type zinc finger domain-containing protein
VDRFQGKEIDVSLRQEEKLVERRVTYALELDGNFYIVENVPARVDEETGEQYFSPKTLERLQQIILAPTEPSKMVETPVYEYSS